MTNSLVFGDYVITGMFAWIIAQSILIGDFLWLGIGIALFNTYAAKRKQWNDR